LIPGRDGQVDDGDAEDGDEDADPVGDHAPCRPVGVILAAEGATKQRFGTQNISALLNKRASFLLNNLRADVNRILKNVKFVRTTFRERWRGAHLERPNVSTDSNTVIGGGPYKKKN
jgi:hypothetical protein